MLARIILGVTEILPYHCEQLFSFPTTYEGNLGYRPIEEILANIYFLNTF